MQRRFRGDVAGIWSKLEYGLQASVLFGGDVDPGARGLGSKLSKLGGSLGAELAILCERVTGRILPIRPRGRRPRAVLSRVLSALRAHDGTSAKSMRGGGGKSRGLVNLKEHGISSHYDPLTTTKASRTHSQ